METVSFHLSLDCSPGHCLDLQPLIKWEGKRPGDSTASCLEFGSNPEVPAVFVQWLFVPQLLRVDISILDLHSTILDSAVNVCFGPVPQGELLVSTSSNKILVLDAKTGRLVREVGH